MILVLVAQNDPHELRDMSHDPLAILRCAFAFPHANEQRSWTITLGRVRALMKYIYNTSRAPRRSRTHDFKSLIADAAGTHDIE